MEIQPSTYTERRIGTVRRFDLAETCLKVSQRGFAQEKAELQFDLKNVSPNVGKVWVKNTLLVRIILLCFTLFLFLGLLTMGGWLEIPHSVPVFFGICGMGLVGLIVSFVTPPQIEYTVFTFRQGPSAFTIGKAGKEKHRYEAFVDQVIQRIPKTRD